MVWQDKQKAVVLSGSFHWKRPSHRKDRQEEQQEKSQNFAAARSGYARPATSRPIDAALTNTKMMIKVVVAGIDLDCRNVCYSETAHYFFASDRK